MISIYCERLKLHRIYNSNNNKIIQQVAQTVTLYVIII